MTKNYSGVAKGNTQETFNLPCASSPERSDKTCGLKSNLVTRNTSSLFAVRKSCRLSFLLFQSQDFPLVLPPAGFLDSGLMESEFEFITICGKAGNERSITNSFLHLLSIIFIRRQAEEAPMVEGGGNILTGILTTWFQTKKNAACSSANSSNKKNVLISYVLLYQNTQIWDLISLLLQERFHNLHGMSWCFRKCRDLAMHLRMALATILQYKPEQLKSVWLPFLSIFTLLVEEKRMSLVINDRKRCIMFGSTLNFCLQRLWV